VCKTFISKQLDKELFSFSDPIIEMLQVLDPNTKHSEYPSLVPLAQRFPNFLSESIMQQLDDEWRKLAIVPLLFNCEGMDPIFHRLSKLSDGTGNPCTFWCFV